MTLFCVINLGRFCHFSGYSEPVLLFLAHFQAIIVDNFGILELFQMLMADIFGILELIQLLIGENFGILVTLSGINCGQVLWGLII